MQQAYVVSGNLVEHTGEPRFQAVVHRRDGDCYTIEEVEWIDNPRRLTPEHKQFVLHLALISWASRHGVQLD